jgi:hypothetical protein
MHTRPEPPDSNAVEAAATEARQWVAVADAVPSDWADVVPTESAVIGYHDPAEDLDRRAARWAHRLPDHSLSSLAMFAAALARAESEAWDKDEPHVATRAYEDRRFLAGDRLVHWAVPWLDTVGRCYSELRSVTHAARDELLALADHLRVAPDLGVSNDASALGEDAYGPKTPHRIDGSALRSLWSGTLILDATLISMMGHTDIATALRSRDHRTDLSALFWIAGGRWAGMASRHPGSATLWRALADRADRTCMALSLV